MGFGRDPAPSLGWQRARSRSLSALPQLAAHALWRSGTDRLRRFALPRAPQPSQVKLSTTTSAAYIRAGSSPLSSAPSLRSPSRRLWQLVLPRVLRRALSLRQRSHCRYRPARPSQSGSRLVFVRRRGAVSRPWLMAVELVCRTHTTLLQRAAAGPTHERCEAHPSLRTDIWLQSERPSALSHRYAHISSNRSALSCPHGSAASIRDGCGCGFLGQRDVDMRAAAPTLRPFVRIRFKLFGRTNHTRLASACAQSTLSFSC